MAMPDRRRHDGRDEQVEHYLVGDEPSRADRVKDALAVEHLSEGEVLGKVAPITRKVRGAVGPHNDDGNPVERNSAKEAPNEEASRRHHTAAGQPLANDRGVEQERRDDEEPANHAIKAQQHAAEPSSVVELTTGVQAVLVGGGNNHCQHRKASKAVDVGVTDVLFECRRLRCPLGRQADHAHAAASDVPPSSTAARGVTRHCDSPRSSLSCATRETTFLNSV